MSRRLRAILTALFAVGFAVTAPVVLFFTAGYRYDWHKHRLQKTGIIQTDSAPDAARVLLNGVDTGQVTPSPLTRLLPEEYRLRFEKAGYLPWEKTVEVRSGETTFVTAAALVRAAETARLIGTEATLAAFTPDGSAAAWFTEIPEWRELRFADFHDRSATGQVVLARFAQGAFADAALQWSPDGRRLLLVADNATRGTTVITYDRTGDAVSLHDRFPATRLAASWSDDGNEVVIVSPDGVYLADPQDGTAAPAALLPDVNDATVLGRTLFLLRAGDDDVTLERQGLAPDDERRIVATLPHGDLSFLESRAPYLIVADHGRGRIMAVSTDDGRVADTLAATEAHWSDQRDDRLLACNDFEMTVADLRDGTRQLITRLGTRIDGCAWRPEGSAAFYAAGDAIQAIDLDVRDPKNVNLMSPATGFAGFAADAEDGMLRFFGNVDGTGGIYERAY